MKRILIELISEDYRNPKNESTTKEQYTSNTTCPLAKALLRHGYTNVEVLPNEFESSEGTGVFIKNQGRLQNIATICRRKLVAGNQAYVSFNFITKPVENNVPSIV